MPESRLLIRIKAAIGLILLSMCLYPFGIRADETPSSPVSAETRVSNRQVTVGDLLTFSIVVRHDPGIHLAPPDPVEHFKDGFELVDRGTSEPETANGQIEETFWLKLRADKVGFYSIPPITVDFTAPSPENPSQAIPGTLKTLEAAIEIRSVLYRDNQEPTDIKDIKPIIGAGFDWRRYLNWVYLALGILAAMGLFVWWLQSRQQPTRPRPEAPPELKPHEIALAELDRLLARNLIAAGRHREHYFELSEILRRYLGAVMNIPALDWTTEEITAYLSGRGKTDPEFRQKILALLPVTDRIKFAQAPVDPETAAGHVAAVRNLVQHSAPKITSKYQIKTETAA